VEEKISLSDRFGLWIAFHPFTQDQYLAIVHHWLGRLGAACRAPGDGRSRRPALGPAARLPQRAAPPGSSPGTGPAGAQTRRETSCPTRANLIGVGKVLKIFCSPARYVQGRDASRELAREMVKMGIGARPLIIASPTALSANRAPLDRGLRGRENFF
jgi:hypothetical protein